MSSFSWLDQSEAQRRQMLEIVDQFREKGTLDELGFGSIRDSLADHFFPGTSTIHTRARYLLFVPWIYRGIERAGLPQAQVEARASHDQARLAIALQKGGERESQGVIGIQAGAALQRTPAAIYWGALRRFRLWRYPGTIGQYYAAVRRSSSAAGPVQSDDGELVEQSGIVGWHRDMPKAPTGLFDSATFALTAKEADYLRERIIGEAPGTLLALCIEGTRHIGAIDHPWLHPGFSSFPKELKSELDHAHRFSAVAYGGALLYNLMLAEKAAAIGLPVADGLADERRQQMDVWAAGVTNLLPFFREWSMGEFWRLTVHERHRVSYPTRQFVEALAAFVHADPHLLADNVQARSLIQNRERSLKGSLARLTNRPPLERFSGAAGLVELTYRWPNVKRIVRDIQRGLARHDDAEDPAIA